ncbi:MAG: hypothetical protein ACTSV2_02320 [Candidatus Thorarchaeota archaeon]
MTARVLIVFDFDRTLVHDDGQCENFEVLTALRKKDVELAIASRNDQYHLTQMLNSLGIYEKFRYIMADFRPKSIQLRHIVTLFADEGNHFDTIYFIDDYAPNIERMRLDEPEVKSFHFGVDLQSIDELLEVIADT